MCISIVDGGRGVEREQFRKFLTVRKLSASCLKIYGKNVYFVAKISNLGKFQRQNEIFSICKIFRRQFATVFSEFGWKLCSVGQRIATSCTLFFYPQCCLSFMLPANISKKVKSYKWVLVEFVDKWTIFQGPVDCILISVLIATNIQCFWKCVFFSLFPM